MRGAFWAALLSAIVAPVHSQVESIAFAAKRHAFDHEKREIMIPMRDGIKLKTFLLVPKGARDAPIVLTRTPYNAGKIVSGSRSPRLANVVPRVNDTSAAAGYIVAYQDIRGRYGSQGDYVMNRPLVGPLNRTGVDHATDAYDTIDWLVRNVPESNGRVGIIGGSYAGFTTAMATVRPHPALRVAIPFEPMIDGWIGDDWFHNGAFRQDGPLAYLYEQEASRGNAHQWWTGFRDTYDEYLGLGSAGAVAASRGLEQLSFWRELVAHPAYDSFWQNQAVDKLLAKEPLIVPMLIVSGLFDQEDIYGGPALFKALSVKDPEGTRVHLALGPWSHGQARREGRNLGVISFEGDTATRFRRDVMQPFLDHYLKDAPRPDMPRVLVYETGVNEWHRYDAWPQSCASKCAHSSRNLYLQSDGGLDFERPLMSKAPHDEYVSDPSKPVPYRQRPTLNQFAGDSTWGEWLVDDQRHAASRPDVLVYQTEALQQPLRLAGEPIVRLFASTSGSDSDWVVKLIDVWPDEVSERPQLGGYQQMVAADILRGRYRENPAEPRPLASNRTLEYVLRLPNVSHAFLPGHRVMVQIQSTWFPLYDRNPQTYVPNIMLARPGDFTRATQRIFRTGAQATHIEMPVIP